MDGIEKKKLSPEERKAEDLKEVMKEETERMGDAGGKKPGLDYYDNRRDRDPGNAKSPEYDAKFGKWDYDNERE